jgi:predicted RNase H-like nuclease (RuvC/YqgF family)
MAKDLQEEVEWLEHKVETLEKHIELLERENFHLRGMITKTIHSLEESNRETKKMIYGQTYGSVVKNSDSFTPYYAESEDEED